MPEPDSLQERRDHMGGHSSIDWRKRDTHLSLTSGVKAPWRGGGSPPGRDFMILMKRVQRCSFLIWLPLLCFAGTDSSSIVVWDPPNLTNRFYSIKIKESNSQTSSFFILLWHLLYRIKLFMKSHFLHCEARNWRHDWHNVRTLKFYG